MVGCRNVTRNVALIWSYSAWITKMNFIDRFLLKPAIVWCCKYVMEAHQMSDLGFSQPEPVCFRCGTSWPCDEFVEAEERLNRWKNEYI